MEDIEEFREFQEWVRGKSDQTKYGYKNSLKKYCEFRDKSPEELVDEFLGDREHEDPRDYGRPERELRKYKEKLKERVDKGGMSPATMQQHFSRIKSFYSFWDCDLDFQIPKGEPVSRKLTLRKGQIRRLVGHAPTARDKAIIMMGFQTGMGAQEICNLNYGPVAERLGPPFGEPEQEEEPPLRIQTKRHKVGSNFETYLGENGIEYLKRYLEERRSWDEERREYVEPDWDDPLFAKEKVYDNTGDRLKPKLIQKMLRGTAVRSGVVSRERMENSKQNPARFHAIRAAFSSLCKLKGIAKEVREFWMEHSRPYRGAYDEYTVEELKDLYGKVEPELSIWKTEEEVQEVREETSELKVSLHDERKKREQLEDEVERVKEELAEVRSIRDKEATVARAFAELKDEEIQEMFRFTRKLYKLAKKDPEVREKLENL